MSFLENPRLSLEVKKQLLQDSLPGVSPLALNFVYFLTAKGRLGIFEQVVAEYERFVDAHYGIDHAEVTTAVPLEEGDKNKLADRLAAVLSRKKVVIENKVEPAIVGGMIARIGDKLIDGSLRSKLSSLKRVIQSGAFT
jgi:F-type H+-transporting ATPase subunit delta